MMMVMAVARRRVLLGRRLFVSAVAAVVARFLLRGLLGLVAMVLKPDLHLRRAQTQRMGELIAILCVQIATLVEALLELEHLLLTEENATLAFGREGERMVG